MQPTREQFTRLAAAALDVVGSVTDGALTRPHRPGVSQPALTLLVAELDALMPGAIDRVRESYGQKPLRRP